MIFEWQNQIGKEGRGGSVPNKNGNKLIKFCDKHNLKMVKIKKLIRKKIKEDIFAFEQVLANSIIEDLW